MLGGRQNCASPPLRMLSQGRRLLQPLFRGRLLLLTNTVSCGTLLAAGDALQQFWQLRREPQAQHQLARTGGWQRSLPESPSLVTGPHQ